MHRVEASLQVGILKEMQPGETRVALLPESLKGLLAQGVTVLVESGAGALSGASDEAYIGAGAVVGTDRALVLATSQILPVVQAPSAEDQARLQPGAVLIGFMRALEAPQALATAIAGKVTIFSMELVPRITRAQAMDALSSMATVAGYKAVIEAANILPRLFPLLMTAAGTIAPAKVFIIGAGVAGLQAIATARRLGAVVEAYDVRAAAGEQVRSLGAKFLDVDLGGISGEGEGGYARELSEEALERGRTLIAQACARADVVITTAQVPGRPAPLLIRRGAVEGMKPGSVLVDLAAPAGGNCELTKPGVAQNLGGVRLLAPMNLAAQVPVHASQLYARNVLNFLGLILKKGEISPDFSDEILTGTCVARDGEAVHPRVAALLQPKAGE
jgi:NAD(P) transhydrogenase subunit alpha